MNTHLLCPKNFLPKIAPFKK